MHTYMYVCVLLMHISCTTFESSMQCMYINLSNYIQLDELISGSFLEPKNIYFWIGYRCTSYLFCWSLNQTTYTYCVLHLYSYTRTYKWTGFLSHIEFYVSNHIDDQPLHVYTFVYYMRYCDPQYKCFHANSVHNTKTNNPAFASRNDLTV